jgi:hypothetical protein
MNENDIMDQDRKQISGVVKKKYSEKEDPRSEYWDGELVFDKTFRPSGCDKRKQSRAEEALTSEREVFERMRGLMEAINTDPSKSQARM